MIREDSSLHILKGYSRRTKPMRRIFAGSFIRPYLPNPPDPPGIQNDMAYMNTSPCSLLGNS
jgi:hypothetical protein